MKVLLIGATGATGSDLLQLLLDNSGVESVDLAKAMLRAVKSSGDGEHLLEPADIENLV